MLHCAEMAKHSTSYRSGTGRHTIFEIIEACKYKIMFNKFRGCTYKYKEGYSVVLRITQILSYFLSYLIFFI